MLVTVKSVSRKEYQIEVDIDKDTVQTLKEKLCEESKQEHLVEQQQLIYLGKIMSDDRPLSTYQLGVNNFIVVMNKKPITVPVKSEVFESTAATTSAALDTVAAATNEEDYKDSKLSAPVDASNPEEIQMNIQRMKEMGYSEEEAKIALELCDNKLDTTIEFLCSNSSDSTEAIMPATDTNALEFLRTHPAFVEMKQLVQRNPNTLPHLMEKLHISNPDVVQIISDNPDEFNAMLNEPSEAAGGLQLSVDNLDVGLNSSDIEVISRLRAFGYPEYLVIQAYIACERNEELAANFLESQMLDDFE